MYALYGIQQVYFLNVIQVVAGEKKLKRRTLVLPIQPHSSIEKRKLRRRKVRQKPIEKSSSKEQKHPQAEQWTKLYKKFTTETTLAAAQFKTDAHVLITYGKHFNVGHQSESLCSER